MKVGLHVNHARWDEAQGLLADIEPMSDVLGLTSASNLGLQRMLIGYFRREFAEIAAGFSIMCEATPAWDQLFPYDALVRELDGSIPPAVLGRLADEWFSTVWPFAPNWMGAAFLGAIGPILRHASPATAAERSDCSLRRRVISTLGSHSSARPSRARRRRRNPMTGRSCRSHGRAAGRARRSRRPRPGEAAGR